MDHIRKYSVEYVPTPLFILHKNVHEISMLSFEIESEATTVYINMISLTCSEN